jgi:hypothetical protein
MVFFFQVDSRQPGCGDGLNNPYRTAHDAGTENGSYANTCAADVALRFIHSNELFIDISACSIFAVVFHITAQ